MLGISLLRGITTQADTMVVNNEGGGILVLLLGKHDIGHDINSEYCNIRHRGQLYRKFSRGRKISARFTGLKIPAWVLIFFSYNSNSGFMRV